MDKIKKYRSILEDYINYRASLRLASSPGAKAHPIIDREKDEYVLLWSGWTGNNYKHSLMFHFQLIEGKIWIHENRTDIDLLEIFKEKGVPENDIMLGFVAPHLRDNIKVAA